MSRIWKEERKGHWSKHFDLHGYQGLPGHDVSPDEKLVPVYTYFVEVCNFTFRFGSVAQIDSALEYYSRKIQPSSRLPRSLILERGLAQRWYQRLPLYLREEKNRLKVVKALRQAAVEFSNYRGKFPTQEMRASNLPLIRRHDESG